MRAERVALQRLAGRPAGRGRGHGLQRVAAAGGVVVGLGAGHRGLAEQVDRAGHPGLPQALELAQRLLRRLAGDEAVGHVAHADRGGAAQRARPAGGVGGAQRGVQRRRALGHLLQVGGQVAGPGRRSTGRRASRPPAGTAPTAAPRRARPSPWRARPRPSPGCATGAGRASWISVPIAWIAGSRSTPTPYPGRARANSRRTTGSGAPAKRRPRPISRPDRGHHREHQALDRRRDVGASRTRCGSASSGTRRRTSRALARPPRRWTRTPRLRNHSKFSGGLTTRPAPGRRRPRCGTCAPPPRAKVTCLARAGEPLLLALDRVAHAALAHGHALLLQVVHVHGRARARRHGRGQLQRVRGAAQEGHAAAAAVVDGAGVGVCAVQWSLDSDSFD